METDIVRLFARLLALACVLVVLGSVLALLNITAPNPTGRRYSSQYPLTVGDGRQIGASAEWILARDLRLPNNNDADQRQCICSAGRRTPNECNGCVHTQAAMSSSYRIPDFISPRFIAESKNRNNLLYAGREVEQIRDYALAALMLKIPLWVYVRVDTPVAPEFVALTESTGGGVVYYFSNPTYADPVDRIGWAGLLISAPLGIASLWLGFRRQREPVSQAARTLDHAAAFSQRVKAKLHEDLHQESP